MPVPRHNDPRFSDEETEPRKEGKELVQGHPTLDQCDTKVIPVLWSMFFLPREAPEEADLTQIGTCTNFELPTPGQ